MFSANKLFAFVFIFGSYLSCWADEYHQRNLKDEALSWGDGSSSEKATIEGTTYSYCYLYFFIKIIIEYKILDAIYWKQLGQQLLREEVQRQRYGRIDTSAKNIIFFLGDGS